MTITESLVVSVFCMALVFVVLACLFAFVRILTAVTHMIEARVPEKQVPAPPLATDVPAISAGELRLYNVDEKTAAMIMAIVSDESQMPLSQLSFKSIRAVEES